MENIRVRFAPSPTGALHIGGVRTALYNYLFAKKYGGTFILRIEDTDQSRYVDGAEKYIMEALEWLGLEFDESPLKGGSYGPYRQSERKESGLYSRMAEELVKKGHAYYAYDTEEELAAERKKAEDSGGKFKYDASTRMSLKNSLNLSEEKCRELELSGAPKVIRIKNPESGEVFFEDLVRGVVRFDCAELDDKVMLKNDGMPTYHLANIVDDYHMKISHVIRGEEWLPSTPIHVLLYRFFGWEDVMPVFAHLPLILKPEPAAYLNKKSHLGFSEKFTHGFMKKYPDYDKSKVQNIIQPILQDFKNISGRIKINEKKDSGLVVTVKEYLKSVMYGKLSKRDGDRLGIPVFPLDWIGENSEDSFRGFREWGFLPDAVVNILALLGWNDGTEKEIYNENELMESFEMGRVSSAGARFNFEKAKWFNKQYINNRNVDKLLDEMTVFYSDASTYPKSEIRLLTEILKPRLNYINEFYDAGRFYFEDFSAEDTYKKYESVIAKKILPNLSGEVINKTNELIKSLDDILEFEVDEIENIAENIIAEVKSSILPFIRLAISGEMGGPSIYQIMAVIGKEKTKERLTAFKEYIILQMV